MRFVALTSLVLGMIWSACSDQGGLVIPPKVSESTEETDEDRDAREADDRYRRFIQSQTAPVTRTLDTTTQDDDDTQPEPDTPDDQDQDEEDEPEESTQANDWPAFGAENQPVAAAEEDGRVTRTESRASVPGVRLGVAGVKGFNRDTQSRFTRGTGHHSGYKGRKTNLERSMINAQFKDPEHYMTWGWKKGYLAQYCDKDQGGDLMSEKCRIESRNFLRWHLIWKKRALEKEINDNPNRTYETILDMGQPRPWNWDYARMHLLILTDREWDLYWPQGTKEFKDIGKRCTIHPGAGDHTDEGQFTGRQCQQLYPPSNSQSVNPGRCDFCGQ